jgi:hypothetical protein
LTPAPVTRCPPSPATGQATRRIFRSASLRIRYSLPLGEVQTREHGGAFLANGIQGMRVQAQEVQHCRRYVVSTNVVTVRAWIDGFDINSITLVSSIAKPPCSDCFFRLPV